MKQREEEIQMKLEDYKKTLEKEQQAQIKRKTQEIAAQYKQERDKEIEKAIESMDAEAQAGRKELQEALRSIYLNYHNLAELIIILLSFFVY